MGLSFVGSPNPRHAYKKCVPSLPKDHSWHILVTHATMSICISNIYDDISQKSSKGWDEGDHSCTIAYTPKTQLQTWWLHMIEFLVMEEL
jgi:hypothetical protein